MSVAWIFPGQGAQRQGMGAGLLDRYPDLVARADEIIGVSLRRLCAGDEERLQHDTRYVQPALFAVAALAHRAALEEGPAPAYLAGHSLGEIAALHAAGCFDFETGLRIVRRRGELMARARGGGMLAVVGMPVDRLREVLAEEGATDVDLANHNSPDQVVLSGPEDSVRALAAVLRAAGAGKCVLLNVSIAAHSRYMAFPAAAFAEYLRTVDFAPPRVPVVSNVTARPHRPETLPDLLARQVRSPVRWWDTMVYLAGQGVRDVREIGPGQVLTKLWRKAEGHLVASTPGSAGPAVRAGRESVGPGPGGEPYRVPAERLGSAEFRRDYGTRLACAAPADANAAGSADEVTRTARRGVLAFLGVDGLPAGDVERAVQRLRRDLGPGAPYGVALDARRTGRDEAEQERVAGLCLRYGVRFLHVTIPHEPLAQAPSEVVRFRFAGAYRDAAGLPVAPNRLVARVAAPDLAERLMRPPAEPILAELSARGALTPAEVEVARRLPVSEDVCLDCSSAGPGLEVLLPEALRRRDEVVAAHGHHVRVGAACATPEAAAVAFVLGADFVVAARDVESRGAGGRAPERPPLLPPGGQVEVEQVEVEQVEQVEAERLMEAAAGLLARRLTSLAPPGARPVPTGA
ncbi:ACP S-malonyltransferase [Microbispora sp. KK1-11]|uniref:ACP S-malonyltransferase n=1 Tax=Microbispora sp. KK1-11 TaxID=2053005 RepID=UPI00115931C4|nr:ACP S-malonyltransferase [Microbispora sp. KK1-11]TQS26493.1 ACP S-malonyltransferase [Microbispora sp. KK1-11]